MTELSVCEEQVLMTVYRHDEAPVMQDVLNVVNRTYQHEWKPQTVSTFLTRCVQKGYLTMQRKGRYAYYYPVIPIEEYQRMQLIRMKDNIFNGDIEQLQKCLEEVKER